MVRTSGSVGEGRGIISPLDSNKLVNFGNSLLIESENKNYSVMLESNMIDEFCNDIRDYIG